MFGGMNSGPSLADIGALLGNRNGDGFGNGGWWPIILLVALFGGWGNGGFFGNRGGNDGGCGCSNGGSGSASLQGALTRGDLCMDMNFQELKNSARNTEDTLNVGLANLNNAFCQQSYETQALLNSLGVTALQTANSQNITALTSLNTLQSLINQCCCDIKSLFAQAEYNRATDACAITQAIRDAARDIVQNDNANYRQLHDEQIALQMQQKDSQLNAAQQALNKCDTQNIVNAAVASIVSQIHPPAGPAWLVPPPYATANYQYYPQQGNCNCGSGWGNNNFNFG